MGGPWAAGVAAGLVVAVAAPAEASDVLEDVVIVASRESAGAQPDTSSEGVVLATELDARPLLRPGEVLEAVPGLIVTQHSGDGKANQYFLRGFNLDHGTDFATFIDGLPMNMPTHAHGQGYTDLNSLIPELIERIDYRKGPYFAEEGDFSAAGSARIRYARRLDEDFATVSAGDGNYRRGVAGASAELMDGDLIAGLDVSREDGPWELPEGFGKVSAVIKYSRGDSTDGWALTATGYNGHWRSSDQIPLRAVEEGLLSRFGAIDPTDGGSSHRDSLALERWLPAGGGELRALAYAIDYRLDLFSNFTYFEDPVHGDQFEQFDQRRVVGGGIDWARPVVLGEWIGQIRTGIQVRVDHIDPVGLYETTNRIRWHTLSSTRVDETNLSSYAAYETSPAPWVRVALGMRVDSFDFEVDADRPVNSGAARAAIGSPKAALTLGPWRDTEYFIDLGKGFHSNDARGTTIRVDPRDGVTPVPGVTPVVRARGAEIGVRTSALPGAMLSVTVWTLALDSELTLNNDASAIEPSGSTRRYGVELAASWKPAPEFLVDADVAWTHARYAGYPAAGQFLPNSLEQVASIGISRRADRGWFGSARLRYLGAAPITPDDSVRSRSSFQVSAELGYQFTPALAATLNVFNLLNRADDDIEYYYASQLRGETAPVNDIHFHPSEPRSARVSLRYRF